MKTVNVMIGPPSCAERDSETVEKFVSLKGQHFVCGGTTAEIVARRLNKQTVIPIESEGDAFPFGKIGNDIVATEGVITLLNIAKAFERNGMTKTNSGEYLLYSAMLESDVVNIFFGTAKNPLHSGDISFEKKKTSILYIKEKLTELKKTVNLYQN